MRTGIRVNLCSPSLSTLSVTGPEESLLSLMGSVHSVCSADRKIALVAHPAEGDTPREYFAAWARTLDAALERGTSEMENGALWKHVWTEAASELSPSDPSLDPAAAFVRWIDRIARRLPPSAIRVVLLAHADDAMPSPIRDALVRCAKLLDGTSVPLVILDAATWPLFSNDARLGAVLFADWERLSRSGVDGALLALYEGNARALAHDYEPAFAAYDRGVQRLVDASGLAIPRLTAGLLAGVAECGAQRGYFEEASNLYELAVDLCGQDRDRAGAVRHLFAWSEAMRWADRYEETARLRRKALEMVIGPS